MRYLRNLHSKDTELVFPRGQVSRARITQILNLLHLAPDIQEQILFLPRVQKGRDRIHLETLQSLTAILDCRCGADDGTNCRLLHRGEPVSERAIEPAPELGALFRRGYGF